MSYRATRSILGLPLLVTFLGVLFSAWNVFDEASVPCLTTCTVFQGFTIGGYSMWWGAMLAFAALMLVAFLGYTALGYILAGIGLVLDIGLLGIMLFIAPCSSCLVIALLLVCSFLSFRREFVYQKALKGQRFSYPWLVLVWFVLFTINTGMIAQSYVHPWAIIAPENARIHVYFSPSCSACQELLRGVSPEDAAQIAWYPVAETPQDMAAIKAMQTQIELANTPIQQAFELALTEPGISPLQALQPQLLLLQFKLWRNQAHVLEAGKGIMPFIEFHGTPNALLAPQNDTPAMDSYSTPPPNTYSPSSDSQFDSDLPLDLSLGGFCTENSTDEACP